MLTLIDPELREAAQKMRDSMGRFSPMSLDMLAERRAWIASISSQPWPIVPVVARWITGPPNSPAVMIQVVGARPGPLRPAVLHIHGGGFNAGSALGSIRSLQETARDLDCTVVSVEYRLAPETPFPGAMEDCYAALLWMARSGAEIGVDPARIAVMGESAGGGHAASMVLAARDRREVRVLFQCLSYPMLDDRTGSSRAVPGHIGAFGWNAEANRFGWRCLLGRDPGGADILHGAVPARREDLAGSPPTFIGVGALDLFVDESVSYARRLIEAGTPTELVVAPGAFHGFDTIVTDAAVSRRFTAAKLDALRRAFAAPADQD